MREFSQGVEILFYCRTLDTADRNQRNGVNDFAGKFQFECAELLPLFNRSVDVFL